MNETLAKVPVLVTGGAGFIGGHLVQALVEARARVRVLDDFSAGAEGNLPANGVEVLRGDVRKVSDCAKAAAGCTVVFHLAALGSVPRSMEEPELYNEVNVGGTLNVLEAARAAGVRRMVYSASSSAYGDTQVLPKVETMTPMPMSPYAITKLAGEYYCRVFAKVHGVETVSLRYFNVFGPRQNPRSQYAAVVPAFISALLEKRPPTIYGDGEQTRDFCFVANVVKANLLAAAATRKFSGEVVNIACGERISLNAMLAKMQEILGTRIAPVYLVARAGDVRDSLADIRAAGELLGYEPEVLFEEGLKQTVAAYVSKANER
ncbi:MAG: SDR family oxidoreductase [Phycisphaerales bacterium]|nr:SDR family oxidoreductase [Phycisphaerales bacterium]